MKKFLELLASRGIGDGRGREGHVLPQQKKKKIQIKRGEHLFFSMSA